MILNYIIAFTKLVAKVAEKNVNKNEKLQTVYNTNAQKAKIPLWAGRGPEKIFGKTEKEVLTKERSRAMIWMVSER